MGLGNTTNMVQGVRASNALQSTARGSFATSLSNRIPDDDRAVAVIQNPPRAKNSGAGQGAVGRSPAATFRERMEQFTASSSESLARYRDLSEKVAGGRSSPKALRDQIQAALKVQDYPDLATGRKSFLAFLGSDESNSASKGSTDTRAMSWLKDQPRNALSSQMDIAPGRVLVLLRDMIKPSAAKLDEK